MTAKELRINNYIFYDGEILPVISIHFDNTILLKSKKGIIGCVHLAKKSVQPIPLSEEILLKCGFENDLEYFELLEDEECFLSYRITTKQLGIYIDNTRGIRIWIDCIYLHQLQNIFYSLTRKELKIEL